MSLVINAIVEVANLSTITLCGVMKLPQLYSLMKTKSAAGVSLSSLLLEFSGYCIVMCYGIYSSYPLFSYFEYPLLVIQDLVVLMVLLQNLQLLSPALFIPAAAFMAIMLGVSLGLLPHAIITVIINLCTPLSASSKVVQFQDIVSKGDSTGVSIATWTIAAYTSVARLFTVYVETYDVALMINYIVATILNSAVIMAAVIYSPTRKEAVKKRKD